MDATELIETDEYWLLPLDGREITQTRVDSDFCLVSCEPDREDVVIRRARGWVTGPSGEETFIDAEAPRERLAPALTLYGDRIAGARAWKDGRLEVTFASGRSLQRYRTRTTNRGKSTVRARSFLELKTLWHPIGQSPVEDVDGADGVAVLAEVDVTMPDGGTIPHVALEKPVEQVRSRPTICSRRSSRAWRPIVTAPDRRTESTSSSAGSRPANPV